MEKHKKLCKHLAATLFLAMGTLGCSGNRETRTLTSDHMKPTLLTGDKVVFDSSKPPERGDIVIFSSPHSFDPVLKSGVNSKSSRCRLKKIPIISSIPGLGHPACEQYVSRVIAVAGDSVRIDERGKVILNGDQLEEAYVGNQYCKVDANGDGQCRALNATVPKDHVLVLGDNRSNSWDGRYWPGGAFVPVVEIGGSAVSIHSQSTR